MQFKLTKKEKSWIFYDVGNSAFVLMVSTILPVYFNYLAQNAGVSDVDYLAYWGYAASISTLIVAVLGPVMGTLADTRGFKKPLFLSCILVGCAGCLLMGLTTWWISFLVIFIIAKVGFNSSLVFYDSMLSDVTAPERMDRVSSSGYAWGYAGSCIPFVVSLVFVLGYQKMGLSFETGMMIAFAVACDVASFNEAVSPGSLCRAETACHEGKRWTYHRNAAQCTETKENLSVSHSILLFH